MAGPVTNVPRPRVRSSRRSRTRSVSARRTVMRLQPYSSARSRSVGSRSPACHSPASRAPLRSRYTWWCRGTGPGSRRRRVMVDDNVIRKSETQAREMAGGRAGRAGDRWMGLKVAVVGGGSTYTPELIEGIARRAGVLPVDELVLLDPGHERLAIVAGLARRMLARAGSADPGHRDRRPGRGRRWRRIRAGPAAHRRPGRPDAGRDPAAAIRLRRSGDHRAGRLRQGAPDRAGRARARGAGRATGRCRMPGWSTSPIPWAS